MIVGIVTGVLVSLAIVFCALLFVTCTAAVSTGIEEGQRKADAELERLKRDVQRINDAEPFTVPEGVRLPFVVPPEKK